MTEDQQTMDAILACQHDILEALVTHERPEIITALGMVAGSVIATSYKTPEEVEAALAAFINAAKVMCESVRNAPLFDA